VTGATTLEDSGAKYAVTVSDQTVSIQSSPALLTIGPRSPADGDLRFQEVDASTTANGYTNAEGTSLIYGISYSFPDDTGSPLSVGPGCGTGAVTPYGCTWSLNVAVVPPGVAEVSTSYQVDYLEGFQSDLSALSASNSVITGLDIEPPADAVAFSSIAGTGNGTFTPVFMSVATGSISAAVATEGASGHVVTAVTYDGPDVASFVTYSWSGNADVTYDTEVMSTSYSGLSSALTSLGAQGYIVTAIGGNQQIGIILIGTKVHGDTLARSVLSVYPMAGGDLTQFGALGYAVVGMVYELGDDGNVSSVTWLGEK